MILQKNTGSKFLVVIIFSFISFGCNNTDYQKIIIDNKDKRILLLNDDFVIDSISIQRFGVCQYSCSLHNKSLGKNYIDLAGKNEGYDLNINKLESLNCDVDNLSFSIIIRKKGSNVKVTKDLANNFDVNPDIQTSRGHKYIPCSKEVDTIETDRNFR